MKAPPGDLEQPNPTKEDTMHDFAHHRLDAYRIALDLTVLATRIADGLPRGQARDRRSAEARGHRPCRS